MIQEPGMSQSSPWILKTTLVRHYYDDHKHYQAYFKNEDTEAQISSPALAAGRGCEPRQVSPRAGYLAALLCGCHGTGQAPGQSKGPLYSLLHLINNHSLGIPCSGGSWMIRFGSLPAASSKDWRSVHRVTGNKVRLQRADVSLNTHDALSCKSILSDSRNNPFHRWGNWGSQVI